MIPVNPEAVLGHWMIVKHADKWSPPTGKPKTTETFRITHISTGKFTGHHFASLKEAQAALKRAQAIPKFDTMAQFEENRNAIGEAVAKAGLT